MIFASDESTTGDYNDEPIWEKYAISVIALRA
jgi:hypothetical protein